MKEKKPRKTKGFKHKTADPVIQAQIISERASGAKQQEIADNVGLDISTVCKFVNKEDVKSLIESEQARLIMALPDAVGNVIDLVQDFKGIKKRINTENAKEHDKFFIEMGYKATKDVLTINSVFPSHVTNQYITNLFNQTNNVFPAPVMKLLAIAHQDDDIIDVDLGLDDEETNKEA